MVIVAPPRTPDPSACAPSRVARRRGRWLAAVAAVAVLMVIVGTLGGPIAALVHWPAALLVGLGSLALTAVTVGADGVVTAMRVTLRGPRLVEHAASLRAGDPEVVFGLIAMYGLGLGAAGALLGTISMLASIDRPAALGTATAHALLSLLYGVLLALAAAPLSVAAALDRRRRRAARRLWRRGLAVAACAGLGAAAVVIGVVAVLHAALQM